MTANTFDSNKPGPQRPDPKQIDPGSPDVTKTNRSALIMAAVLGVAGVAHFVVPKGFDEIVPRALPGSARLWTYVSGAAELAVAAGVARRSTRRYGALAALALFVAVYPANLQMAYDWRDRSMGEQLIAYGRLPIQLVLFWWAWRVYREADQAG
jgi:uncharacterized membrane protein